MTSINKILSTYGFNHEQKLAIIKLLDLSGCFTPAKLVEDMYAAKFSEAQIKVTCELISKYSEEGKAELILRSLFGSHFPTDKLGDWPEKTHNWLIQVTQREFFARKEQQERWETTATSWMEKYTHAIHVLTKIITVGAEKPPKQHDYQALIVFGSTGPNMAKRLAYAKALVDSGKINVPHLYLLCGERYVEFTNEGISRDGSLEDLTALASKHRIEISKLTETHLMQEAYECIKDDGRFSALPMTFVDTPRGNKRRPETADTLLLLAELAPSLAEDVIFVSMAPHIKYQEEVTLQILPQFLPSVRPDVVGPEYTGKEIKSLLDGLGGALFMGYIRVAHALGCKLSHEELAAERKSYNFDAQLQQQARQTIRP